MNLVNVVSIKQFKLLILVWLVISDLHLFHLIVLLNSNFNCSKKLLSSSVDKVTTGIHNFVSVIWNVPFIGLLTATTAGFPYWARTASLVALLVNTHFSDHVKKKILFHSQLMAYLVLSKIT